MGCWLKRSEFDSLLAGILSPKRFKDYAPNGLQVQGKSEIIKVVTGVTACQALIDKAIQLEADAIVVHHGYFWQGESYPIVGMKYNRIAALIKHDINLFGYHLPLDAHPVLGNNAQLADRLGLLQREGLQQGVALEESIGLVGDLVAPMAVKEFKALIERVVGRGVLFEFAGVEQVRRVALCTGGAQGYIEQAVAVQADVYITGEVSEKTIHVARELGIHFCAAGHHATERFGVQALAQYLRDEFALEAEFVDIDNPA